jgi:hypothetical protein
MTASGWANFYAFRSATCVPIQKGKKKEMVEWVDKPGAEEAVASLLQDITIRHKFEDCIDIPPTFKHVIKFYPTKKQRGAYESMERDAIALMNKGMVSAVNAAAVRTKMLQIASGAVYENDHKYHLIDTEPLRACDGPGGRAQALHCLLSVEAPARRIGGAWPSSAKITHCVFDGEATDKQRQEMKQQFQAGFYQVMFAHPKVGRPRAHADRAQAAIWPSPPDDLEWWVQANRRHARAGQTVRDRDHRDPRAPHHRARRVPQAGRSRKARMNNLLELMEKC